MNVLIKVTNPEIVSLLQAEGFPYMLETFGEKQLYVFVIPDTVLAKMQGLFCAKDFIVENTLRF